MLRLAGDQPVLVLPPAPRCWWTASAHRLGARPPGRRQQSGPTAGAIAFFCLAPSPPAASAAARVAAAIRLRRWIENEWLLGLAGIASIAFGVLVALFPGAGALSVVWLIGVFAVVFGALAVGVALRLRSLQRTAKARHEEVPAGTATRKWDEDTR
jgi:hypothetical protein